MGKRRETRAGAARDRARGSEWIGGIVSLDTPVSDVEGTFRPDVLLWVGPTGEVLGTFVERPANVLSGAGRHLRETIGNPDAGSPEAPGRIRVSSPALAAALRLAAPGIEVVVVPTPELEVVGESLRAMAEAAATPAAATPSLLEVAPPATCESWLRAAAGLYRAKPWSLIAGREDPLTLSIPALGVGPAIVWMFGGVPESHCILLFARPEDYDEYQTSPFLLGDSEVPDLPPHHALSFVPASEMAEELLLEIEEHGWPVAGSAAYPLLLALDRGVRPRRLIAGDLAVFEALAGALPRFLREPAPPRAPGEVGVPMERAYVVPTARGDVEVGLAAPPPIPRRPARR